MANNAKKVADEFTMLGMGLQVTGVTSGVAGLAAGYKSIRSGRYQNLSRKERRNIKKKYNN